MLDRIPLVIAGHGTRDAHGVDVTMALVDRVRAKLPGTRVEIGFVELVDPPIDRALAEVLAEQPAATPRAVVAPLMVGTGGHVTRDIPEAIEAGSAATPEAEVGYAGWLGADPRLREALLQRIEQARGDWSADQVCVLLVGRGTLFPEANADHARLARLIAEQGGYGWVEPAFIQVTAPALPEALARVAAAGCRRIIVAPNFLFPGRLRSWTIDQASAFGTAHPELEVRVAEVIGDCEELAEVLIDRYRAAALTLAPTEGSPAYLTGLCLAGRRVLVAGGGSVATRRVPRLVAAGARVVVVSPLVSPQLAVLAERGEIDWEARAVSDSDIEGAWFVHAATDDPQVNAQLTELAEARHTFCVRADDSDAGSAWTPATSQVGPMTVAVLGDGRPRLSRAVRDAVAAALLAQG